MAQIEIDLLLEATQALQSIKGFSVQANKELSSIKTASFVSAISSAALAAKEFGRIALDAFSAPIHAALEAEDAINRLDSALLAAGNTVPGVSKDLQEFADSLSQVTRFSDDAIISATGLLQNLAPLSEQGLKAGVAAATDLAAAFKVDLETAIRAVGKAANGEVTALKRLGLEVKIGKTDAETYANALATLARVQGSAVRDGQTFSASLVQVSTAFGNLLEEIGFIIIKNPEVIKTLQESKDAILGLTKEVKELAPAFGEVVSVVAQTFSLIGTSVKEFVISFAVGFNELERIAFETISFILAQLSRLVDSFAAIPGVGKAFEGVAAQLERFSKISLGAAIASEESNKKIVAATTGAANGIRQVAGEVNKGANSGANFLAGARSNIEDVTEKLKQLQGALKNAGLDALQAAKQLRAERISIVDAAFKQEKLNISEAGDLRAKIEKDFQKSRKEFEKSIAEQQRKAIQDQVDDASAFVNQLQGKRPGAGQKGDPSKVSDVNKIALAGAEFGSKILQGAEGAASVLKGLAGGLVEAIAGPIGQVLGPLVSEIVGALAQGPAKVREMVTAFISSIPLLIENILLSIPVLIETLAEQLPLVIERLIENAPRIITEGILPRIPEIITKLVEGAAKAGLELALKMPLVATQLGVSLAAQAPFIALKTVDAFVAEAPRFITELIKSLPGSIGGAAGGIGDSIGGALGGIGDVFGFAEGGRVPDSSKFMGDKFPARLNAGEQVLDRDLSKELETFLGSQRQGGGAQQVNVTLQIGQKELASVLLDLSRGGFRTA